MALDLKKVEKLQEERKLANQIELTRESTIHFGKHKGLKVSEILDDDPSYLIWMSENIDKYRFDESILKEAKHNHDMERMDSDYGMDFDDLMDVPF